MEDRGALLENIKEDMKPQKIKMQKEKEKRRIQKIMG